MNIENTSNPIVSDLLNYKKNKTEEKQDQSSKIYGDKVNENVKALSSKITNIVFNLNTIRTTIKKSPEYISGTVTTGVGLSNLFGGNPLTGVLLTGAGVITLVKSYGKTDESNNLDSLIKDTDSTLEYSNELNQNTLEKCKKIDDHLVEMSKHGEILEEILQNLGELVEEESEDINNQLGKLKEIGEQALELHKKASEQIEIGRSHISSSSKAFVNTNEQLEKITEKLKNEEDLKKGISKFIGKAEKIQKHLVWGENQANAGSYCIGQGKELQGQMLEKYTELLLGQQQFLKDLTDTHGNIIKENNKAQDEVNEIMKEKEEIEKNIYDIRDICKIQEDLLNQCRNNIDAAAKEIQQRESNISILIGFLIGLTTLTLGASIPFVFVATLLGGTLYYFKDSIASKVNDVIYGKVIVDSEELKNNKEPIVHAFNQRSGGLWFQFNKAKPEISTTEGVVQIRLDDKTTLKYPFNLKKIDPISATDAIAINKKLEEMLKEKSITLAQCLKIIDKLQMTSLGGVTNRRRGFVTTAYFALLEKNVKDQVQEDIKIKESELKDLEEKLKLKKKEVEKTETQINKSDEQIKKIKSKLIKENKIKKSDLSL